MFRKIIIPITFSPQLCCRLCAVRINEAMYTSLYLSRVAFGCSKGKGEKGNLCLQNSFSMNFEELLIVPVVLLSFQDFF